MKKELIVERTIEINASVEDVWEAIVNPDITQKYFFGTRVDSEWEIGSPVEYKDKKGKVVVRGEIESIKPGQFLRIKIMIQGKPGEEEQYTTVTYEITDLGRKGTMLTISDGDFSVVAGGQEKYDRSVIGWDKVLTTMKDVVEEMAHKLV